MASRWDHSPKIDSSNLSSATNNKNKRMFPFLISKEEKQAIDNVNEINRRLKKGNRKVRRATKAWLRKNL